MNKIVILVNNLKSGGAEKQSVYLYNALQSEYNTKFIVLYGEQIEQKFLNFIEGDMSGLILLNGNIIKKVIELRKILKSNGTTHIFTYLTKPNFIGSIIAKAAGVKYIYTGVRSSSLPFWKTILEKTASRFFSTATVFNNYYGESIFKKKGFSNTIVISNCFYKIDKPLIRTNNDFVKIISIGRFVPEKDFETALKAISILVQENMKIQFLIIGYGKLEKEIRNQIIELSLENHVKIIINPNNIPQLLNDADIYLSTSLFEGTSNSIMEAMNASLPIVATCVGDNNRLVYEKENGYLNMVGDYKSIAYSLKNLINSYDLRIRFGIKSNELLNEEYSFSKFKNQYIDLITKTR